MVARRYAAGLACALAIGVAGCGSSTSTHDGGGGNGGSGGGGSGGSGGAMDLSSSSSDLGLACNKPGLCAGGGVCCARSIGPHEVIFCDTMSSCPIQHGVDTAQSPLCASAADCYHAERSDLGTLYCCPDPNFAGSGVMTCRSLACP